MQLFLRPAGILQVNNAEGREEIGKCNFILASRKVLMRSITWDGNTAARGWMFAAVTRARRKATREEQCPVYGVLVINLHGNSPAAGAGMPQRGPSAPRCCRML